jgi:uncharacterized protein YgiB involved in biofilm formation
VSRLGINGVMALTLAAIAVVALIPVLALFDDDDDTPAMRLYPDVQSCQAEYSTADCARAFAGAQAAHDGSAPHYGALADCEQLYGPGGCMPRGYGDSGAFIPLMTGFLIGQALAGSSGVVYQPVYVNRQGMAYAGGAVIGTYASDCVGNNCPRRSGGYILASGSSRSSGIWSSGSYTVHSYSHGSSSPMAHGSSISRGGFGSTAHAMGGSSS